MKIIFIDGLPSPVAERWGEVTLGDAARLLSNPDAERDTYGTLAALIGPKFTRAQVMNLPIADAEGLLQTAAFLAEPIPAFTTRPQTVEVLRRVAGTGTPAGTLAEGTFATFERLTLNIPAELKLESFGQACDLGVSIESLAEDLPRLRIRALAIYLLPQFVGGFYDTDRLVEVEEAVASIPIEQAIPITDFFLPISKQPSEHTASAYSSASSPTRSSAPASPSSANGGTPTRWRIAWRAAINYVSSTFSGGRGPR